MSKNGNHVRAIPKTLDGIAHCPRQTEEAKLEWYCTDHKMKHYCKECSRHEQNLIDQPKYQNRLYHIDFPTTGYLWKRNLDRIDIEEAAYYEHKRIYNLPKKKSTRYELGAREFTFTYSPNWYDDATARKLMTDAIFRLLKYYKDEIVTLRAVGEVSSAGLSHVHCFYKLQSGLKITDKNFKRAYSKWDPKKRQGNGFQGGHHQTVKVESDFQGYIDKEISTAWLDITRPDVQEPQN